MLLDAALYTAIATCLPAALATLQPVPSTSIIHSYIFQHATTFNTSPFEVTAALRRSLLMASNLYLLFALCLVRAVVAASSSNRIVRENALPGAPSTEWDINVRGSLIHSVPDSHTNLSFNPHHTPLRLLS